MNEWQSCPLARSFGNPALSLIFAISTCFGDSWCREREKVHKTAIRAETNSDAYLPACHLRVKALSWLGSTAPSTSGATVHGAAERSPLYGEHVSGRTVALRLSSLTDSKKYRLSLKRRAVTPVTLLDGRAQFPQKVRGSQAVTWSLSCHFVRLFLH